MKKKNLQIGMINLKSTMKDGNKLKAVDNYQLLLKIESYTLEIILKYF